MEQIPIKVECHAGYKADEYPKRFIWNDVAYEISEIVDRWYQGIMNPDFPAADYFKVMTDSGDQYLLKHILDQDLWYACL